MESKKTRSRMIQVKNAQIRKRMNVMWNNYLKDNKDY